MKNKILVSLGIAVVTTLLLSVCAYLKVGETWHLKLVDWNYSTREPSEQIIIVGIDPKSTSDQGLGRFYDWSRKYYAKALENLSKYEPKVIGIDLLFTNKSKGIGEEDLINLYMSTSGAEDFANKTSDYVKKNHPDDLAFAKAVKDAGNVVIAGYKVGDEVQTSIPEINAAAKETGLTNAEPDKDGILRRIPLQDSFVAKIAHLAEVPIPFSKDLTINYAAKPYEFKTISFVDVYNGDFAEKLVKGKIVLIGPTDLKLQDVQFTPNSKKTPMPGVEIHANALQTLLEGKILTDQRFKMFALTLLLLTVIAASAFVFLNIPLSILALFVLAIAYAFTAKFMFGRGTILNMFYPYAALLIVYVSTIIYRYLTEFKEKRFIRGAFTHYLSPEVVKELTNHPEKLKVGGEKKILTIMFTDIENFTSYSEKMAPEAITAIINEYLEVMTEIVLRNGGTLDKYEGDAIMAFFGAPIAQDDHAFRACKTALEMHAVLKKLHAKWQSEGKPLLNFRVGIASGEVLVGNMGSRKRFDYTVMGDTVNLAARLEPANKEFQTRIMVNEKTARMCTGKLNFKELGTINVKGKEESVKVFTIDL